jgi:DNA-binding transcriptional MerR regulator
VPLAQAFLTEILSSRYGTDPDSVSAELDALFEKAEETDTQKALALDLAAREQEGASALAPQGRVQDLIAGRPRNRSPKVTVSMVAQAQVAARVQTTPQAHGVLCYEDLPDLDARAGYRGPTACKAAGITYRQLDYWARTGLVEPTLRIPTGSSTQRLYSFRDILVLKVVKRLLDTGVSLQQIRTAVTHLRDRGVEDLAQITLMSDGTSVYECTSADEVIDLVQGGQGVFGITVGQVWRELEGTLSSLPAESGRSEGKAGDELDGKAQDELMKPRRSRSG